MLRKLINSDPAVYGGAPVFAGTNVPVRTLLDYRAGDVPVYEFLVDFPAVSPTQARKVLRWLKTQNLRNPEDALARLHQQTTPRKQ